MINLIWRWSVDIDGEVYSYVMLPLFHDLLAIKYKGARSNGSAILLRLSLDADNRLLINIKNYKEGRFWNILKTHSICKKRKCKFCFMKIKPKNRFNFNSFSLQSSLFCPTPKLVRCTAHFNVAVGVSHFFSLLGSCSL